MQRQLLESQLLTRLASLITTKFSLQSPSTKPKTLTMIRLSLVKFNKKQTSRVWTNSKFANTTTPMFKLPKLWEVSLLMYLIPWLANGFTSRLQSIMELKLISQSSQVRRFLIMSSLLVGYRVLHLLSVYHQLLLHLMHKSAVKHQLE